MLFLQQYAKEWNLQCSFLAMLYGIVKILGDAFGADTSSLTNIYNKVLDTSEDKSTSDFIKRAMAYFKAKGQLDG